MESFHAVISFQVLDSEHQAFAYTGESGKQSRALGKVSSQTHFEHLEDTATIL